MIVVVDDYDDGDDNKNIKARCQPITGHESPGGE
jgi:hypothetical protein